MSTEWNLIRLGSTVHGIVITNCKENYLGLVGLGQVGV